MALDDRFLLLFPCFFKSEKGAKRQLCGLFIFVFNVFVWPEAKSLHMHALDIQKVTSMLCKCWHTHTNIRHMRTHGFVSTRAYDTELLQLLNSIKCTFFISSTPKKSLPWQYFVLLASSTRGMKASYIENYKMLCVRQAPLFFFCKVEIESSSQRVQANTLITSFCLFPSLWSGGSIRGLQGWERDRLQ